MALSDEELSEIFCLDSVARIGELPDGCGASRYTGLEYIEVRHGILALTARGRERLADLQSRDGRVARSLSSPPASLSMTAVS